MDRLLTVEEVAQWLAVNPETIRRYVRSGKLVAVKLGGRFLRFDQKDVEQFINERVRVNDNPGFQKLYYKGREI